MHVPWSIWHGNVHGIYQNLSWTSLNANKRVFCHCSFSSDVVLIQTVVLTYIAGFIAIAGLYLDKAREFIMAYL